ILFCSALPPQLPPTLPILDHFRPIPPTHPIQIPHRRPLPQPPHFRYRLHRIADPPKRPQGSPFASPQTLHFAPRNFIAISIVPLHIARAQRPLMQPVSPDQRIHRVQPRVPEKSHPQRKISLRTIIGINVSARLLPQTPPPKCRLLLNMFVRPRQKSPARPPRHPQHINRHPRRADLGRPPGNPLHFAQPGEHASHRKQPIHLQQVARVQPTHHLARRPRKSRVQRRV